METDANCSMFFEQYTKYILAVNSLQIPEFDLKLIYNKCYLFAYHCKHAFKKAAHVPFGEINSEIRF